MKLRMRLVLALAGAISSAALVVPATAGAAIDQTVTHVEGTIPFAVLCNGVQVDSVEAKMRFTLIERYQASPFYGFALIAAGSGTGEGLVTGAEYRVVVNGQDMGFVRDPSGWAHMDGRILLIGTGAAAKIKISSMLHVVVNAQGELVSFRNEFETTCR